MIDINILATPTFNSKFYVYFARSNIWFCYLGIGIISNFLYNLKNNSNSERASDSNRYIIKHPYWEDQDSNIKKSSSVKCFWSRTRWRGGQEDAAPNRADFPILREHWSGECILDTCGRGEGFCYSDRRTISLSQLLKSNFQKEEVKILLNFFSFPHLSTQNEYRTHTQQQVKGL